MSRKSPSFAQLIDYITKGQIDERYNVFQNLYQRNYDKLKAEFEHNGQRLPSRKNGVYLYHEVLSITRAKGISEKRQKGIFCQLASLYAQDRAGENLVFGGMHDDKSHNLHYHFVISANRVEDSRRLRMSKAEFSQFKKNFEAYVLEQYPELEQAKIIQSEAKAKLSKQGGELKRRTGKLPERERVTSLLKNVFENSFSHADFIRRLDAEGFNFYIRGKNPGVEDKKTGRKYRLRTLGLLEHLEALDDMGLEQAKTDLGIKKKKQTQNKNTTKVESKVEQSSKISNNKKREYKHGRGNKLDIDDKQEKLAKRREQDIKSRRYQSQSNPSSSQKKRDS